jgi:hypothetical protein
LRCTAEEEAKLPASRTFAKADGGRKSVKINDPLAETDAQIKKRRTLEAIKRLLLRESLNHPLTVVFEDLHWMDGRALDG